MEGDARVGAAVAASSGSASGQVPTTSALAPVPVSTPASSSTPHAGIAASLGAGPTRLNWLPPTYRDNVPAEGVRMLEDIKQGLIACVAAPSPSLHFHYIKLIAMYVDLKYPLSIEDRLLFARLTFELMSSTDQSLELAGSWALICSKLINKRRLKLHRQLTLPWQPIFRAVMSHYDHRKTIEKTEVQRLNHGRSMITLAKIAKRFFPPTATAEVWEEFRPLLCPLDMEVYRGIGGLTLFLPTNAAPEVVGSWIEEILGLWECLDASPQLTLLFLELFSNVAEDNLGKLDLGPYFARILTRITFFFDVPVGSVPLARPKLMVAPPSVNLFSGFDNPNEKLVTGLFDGARIVIYSMHAKSEMQSLLSKLMQLLEPYFHPSNEGHWTSRLAHFLNSLCVCFAERLGQESVPDCEIPVEYRLDDAQRKAFVRSVLPAAMLGLMAKQEVMSAQAIVAIKHLGLIEPELVFPGVIQTAHHALSTLTETHQTQSTLELLAVVIRQLVWRKHYPPGVDNLQQLLLLTLPGIDPNDPNKTAATLSFYLDLFSHVPLIDSTQYALSDSVESTMTESDRAARLLTEGFGDWSLQFVDRILAIVAMHSDDDRAQSKTMNAENLVTMITWLACQFIFIQMSDEIHEMVVGKLRQFAFEHVYLHPHALKAVGCLLAAACLNGRSESITKTFLPTLHNLLVAENEGSTLSANELRWYLRIAAAIMPVGGRPLLKYKKELIEIIRATYHHREKRVFKTSGKVLRRALVQLNGVYAMDRRCVTPTQWNSQAWKATHWKHWGEYTKGQDIDMQWHIPDFDELSMCFELVDTFCLEAVSHIRLMIAPAGDAKPVPFNKQALLQDLYVIMNCIRGNIGLGAGMEEDRATGAGIKYTIYNLTSGFHETFDRYERAAQAEPERYYRRKTDARLLADLLHELVQFLTSREDENTVAITMVIKCIRKLFDRGLSKGGDLLGAYRQFKNKNRDLVHFYATKQLPRWILVFRASLLHAQRALNRHHDVTQYSFLLDDLLKLSMHDYTKIRQRAQPTFLTLFTRFPPKYRRKKAMEILAVLSDTSRKQEEMKGACFLTGDLMGAITLSWKLTKQFVVCLSHSAHQDNVKVQGLVVDLARRFEVMLSGPPVRPLRLPPDRLPDLVLELKGRVDIPTDEQREAARVVMIKHAQKSLTIWKDLVVLLLELGSDSARHWRYQVANAIFLGLFIRDDYKHPTHYNYFLQYFVDALVADSLPLREISKQAVTSLLWIFKRTRKRQAIPPEEREAVLANWLANMKHEPISEEAWNCGFFLDKNYLGWSVMEPAKSFYYVPGFTKPKVTLLNADCTPRSGQSENASNSLDEWPAEMMEEEEAFVLENYLKRPEFWQQFVLYHKERPEGHEFNPLHVNLFKHFFQRFRDHFLPALKIELKLLCEDFTEKKSQYMAAEMIAGLVRASKHWPLPSFQKMWEWLIPLLRRTISNTNADWTPCFVNFVADRDPRRLYALNEFLLEAPFKESSSFAQSKLLSLLEVTIGEYSWRYPKINDAVLNLMREHIKDANDLVRHRMSTILSTVFRNGWYPFDENRRTKLNFVQVLTTKRAEFLEEIIKQFEEYKAEGVHLLNTADVEGSGNRGLLLKRQQYIRWSRTVIGWIGWSLFVGFYAGVLPVIPRLVPMFFHMYRDTDQELSSMAADCLGMLVNCFLPPQHLEQIWELLLQTLSGSDMWRIRAAVLPLIQVLLFNNQPHMAENQVRGVVAQVVEMLGDPQLEVRQLAGTTLSGLVKFISIHSVRELCKQFTELAETPVPRSLRRSRLIGVQADGQAPDLQTQVVRRHSGVLGLAALVAAYPYTIPKWMPPVLLQLAKHVNDPHPIGATVKKTFQDFWKTQQDAFHLHQAMFTEEQLQQLTQLLAAPTYFA